jgi:hypothetical protein
MTKSSEIRSLHKRPERSISFNERFFTSKGMGECPHCGHKNNRGVLTRWHFDNCPKNPLKSVKSDNESVA